MGDHIEIKCIQTVGVNICSLCKTRVHKHLNVKYRLSFTAFVH